MNIYWYNYILEKILIIFTAAFNCGSNKMFIPWEVQSREHKSWYILKYRILELTEMFSKSYSYHSNSKLTEFHVKPFNSCELMSV